MKKKAVMGLVGIAAAAAVGGTWAYWNQELSVANNFQSGKFDSDIVEEFTPEEGWLPGETVKKVVSVKNSGNVDMAVEATISQVWKAAEGEEEPTVKFKGEDGLEYAAQIQWGTNVAVYRNPEISEAARLLGIEKEVSSFTEAADNWILVDIEEMQDGSESLYFIYNGIVGEDGETNPLLTSVTMNPAIESGITHKQYTSDGEGGLDLTTTFTSPFNYEDANYTMSINAKTVQANYDAVKEVFSSVLEMADSDEEYLIGDFIGSNGLDRPEALENGASDAE